MTGEELEQTRTELIEAGLNQADGIEEAIRIFAVARELVPEPDYRPRSRTSISTSSTQT